MKRTMGTLLFIMYCILAIDGRLAEKYTEINDTTASTESPSPVRVSRQAFYDESVGLSREDLMQLDDYSRPYVRKGRYTKYDADAPKTHPASKESDEIRLDAKIKPSVTSEEPKTAKVLIKKPIPKFNDIDYEDFQVKVSRLPVKFAESGEHEDEDFNLDDYEFDVGHDEFAGRGKPLEPRIKIKVDARTEKTIKEVKLTTTVPTPPEIKTQSKVVIPPAPQQSTNVKRSAVLTQKVADKMKEDYYDEIVTTTKAPITELKSDLDDDFSDEGDDTREDTKKISVRDARSPSDRKMSLFTSKVGDKGVRLLKKIMNLPLFPKGVSSIDTVI